MKIRFLIATYLFTVALLTQAQQIDVPESLVLWARNYRASGIMPRERCVIEDFDVCDSTKSVRLSMNDVFGSQQWLPYTAGSIYSAVRQLLPDTLKNYNLKITTLGYDINFLTPYSNFDDSRSAKSKYVGRPWVKNLSSPFSFDYGLAGRHISLWASHGFYWSAEEEKWKWQRPFLNDVREDLLTHDIAYSLVVPMLEGSGAIVWSPRERCSSPTEIIVDNDATMNGMYGERNGEAQWHNTKYGFAPVRTTIHGINPFMLGTARISSSTPYGAEPNVITWYPAISSPERLAVYVSYQSLPNSTSTANYVVRHAGIDTYFSVNQQMGSGTWVYLGNFLFTESLDDNYVLLSTQTTDGGLVSADAVRFGGGYGNTDRGGDVSGMLRAEEGARYSMQWFGMPDSIYAKSGGENDYKDDINCRSLSTNYLCGGSVFNPSAQGLGVPIELAVGIHTDAGVNAEGIVGSLGIATTRFGEATLGDGRSRLSSRDLTEEVLSQICNDMPHVCGRWNRRQLWDRNYAETRIPKVPSTIIEMFSHENPNDVELGVDSVARFHLARAIYKGILRYLYHSSGREDFYVQPLPVCNLKFSDGQLSWTAVNDPLEPTAIATHFLVQTAQPGMDFDNGQLICSTYITLSHTPTSGTKIRVSPVNAGGCGMWREIVF